MVEQTKSDFVAKVDIPAGTVISRDMVGLDEQRVNPVVADVLFQGKDESHLVGKVAVQTIFQYQPIPIAAVSFEDNPAAESRLSLTLTDPAVVAMVVPVDKETSPSKIVPGDYVDLNFGVGSAQFLAGQLSTAPTPFPFQPLPGVFVTQPPLPLPPTLTPTAEPRLTLPVAKTIVHAARVLSVIYDEAPNPAYAGPTSGESPTIRGDIVGIVVTVPREAEELVHFGAVNGSLRVALLAPGADWAAEANEPRKPSLGMSWDDFVALMRLDREAALATAFPTEIDGPGAAAIEATLNALEAGQATPIPASINPTATLEPTATSTAKP